MGVDRGLEEVHSTTYPPGRDLVGYSALAEGLEEDSVEGWGVIHIVHGHAQDSRGFQDGGGLIQNTDMDNHTLLMSLDMGSLGIFMDCLVTGVPQKRIRTGILQHNI